MLATEAQAPTCGVGRMAVPSSQSLEEMLWGFF